MLKGASEVSIYTNRSVTFRFSGLQLEFALSLGLFSSSQVDRGSRLLLKSLAGHEITLRAQKILDAGSGVGVLGVSLPALCPDALAVLFSKYNADANRLANTSALGELAFETPKSEFDLIVANLPAKAGASVLAMFCRRALGLLAHRGVVALVVVAPLESLVRDSLAEASGEIIFEERGAAHTVLHAVAPTPSIHTTAVSREPIDPAYLRTSSAAVVAGTRIELDTVHGLGEFDTPSFATSIAAELFSELSIERLRGGSVLYWNPGQGHIPLLLAQRRGRRSRLARASDLRLQPAPDRIIWGRSTPPGGTIRNRQQSERAIEKVRRDRRSSRPRLGRSRT